MTDQPGDHLIFQAYDGKKIWLDQIFDLAQPGNGKVEFAPRERALIIAFCSMVLERMAAGDG